MKVLVDAGGSCGGEIGGRDDAPLDRVPPRPEQIVAAANRLRAATSASIRPDRVAPVLGATCLEICPRSRPFGSGLIARVADRWGYSEELLDASLAALLKPFTAEAIGGFARKVPPRRELIGFVMPGNVPGAGLHEVVAALISGCAAIIKTASGEPLFFQEFARLLATIDGGIGARIAVFNWGRGDSDLTAALRQICDRLVVFGGDPTVANLQDSARGRDSGGPRLREDFTGFGSRVSGVILAHEALARDSAQRAMATLVARDVALFEQRGCLSPHHVFVEDGEGGRSCGFAACLAQEMASLARELPPPKWLGLEPASAVRRARESARWRGLGGQEVRLWEGGGLGWTVIYDRDTPFRISPGFRTVYVSPFNDAVGLESRLQPVKGQIEAFALAGIDSRTAPIRAMLERFGATYVCRPGAMQSPPLDWPHGGGAFLRSLLDER
jgi:Acyl-CoA reductase (LuxC)